MKRIDQIISACVLAACLGGGLVAANWPSVSGSTARGVVLEDGAGNKLGVSGSPLFISAPGRLIGRQTFCASGCTATGGVYTPTANTGSIVATCVGGGGASGGSALTGAGAISAGSGGAGGGLASKRITSAFSGITVTIGAGGTAGAAGAAGNNGGNTTFGALLTANGGNGGAAGASGTTGVTVSPTGGTASGGDINITGSRGGLATYLSAVTTLPGRGGDAPFGLGLGGPSIGTTGTQAGIAGSGFGSGAGGASNGASQGTASTGAAGQPGICIVDEYSS